MNLIATGSNLTMSSREIASVVNSRHSDVCTSIKRLMEKGTISQYAALPYTHQQNGQTYHEFFIGQRDSYVVVAQLSPEFTAALVDRWQELENKSQPSWISNLSPEAKIALQDLSNQLEEKAVHIERLESLFHNGGTIAQFSKQLNGVNSHLVNSWLYEKTNWLYDDNKGKVYLSGRKQGQPKPAYWRCASYARDKYLTESNYNIEPQGMESINKYEVRLLADGKKWLFSKYIKGDLPMKSDWDGELTHQKDLI